MTLCILFFAFQFPEMPAISFSTNACGKMITIDISKERLAASPSWNDGDENPPLSARKAMKLASAVLDSLVKQLDREGELKWELRSVSLCPTQHGKWFWRITYDAHRPGVGLAGQATTLDLAVLMDGSVIDPRIEKPISSEIPEEANNSPLFKKP